MTKKIVERYQFTENQKREINKMVGVNLGISRKFAGLSQTDVMIALYGVTNNRNRISEIENGRSIDISQLLLFCRLYGVSADYILGLSCEPINDIYASHINNVMANTRTYFEPMIEAMVENAVKYIGKLDKDNHTDLIECADKIGHYLLTHGAELKEKDENAFRLMHQLAFIVRKIKVAEANRHNQMYAHLETIQQRHDKAERHILLDDLTKQKQYTLPLPEPIVEHIEVEVS